MLLVMTGVVFVVIIIWQQAHQNNNQTDSSNNLTCQTDPNAYSKPTKGKLKGTILTNFKPIKKVSNIECIDSVVGTGAEANGNSLITVNYTGALAKNGKIFESSLDAKQPLTSELSGLINGWQIAIPGMKEGGQRRILIPAALGYGSQARADIPANSDLVFDISLISSN